MKKSTERLLVVFFIALGILGLSLNEFSGFTLVVLSIFGSATTMIIADGKRKKKLSNI